AADLDRFLRHEPVTARPIGRVARRLRQWRRAPARPLAVFALGAALLTAAVALPVLRHQQALRVQAQKDALHATLPSVLAVEGWPDERVLAELHAEHRTAIGLLDEILALDPGDLPVRLWRACLCLDLGDRAAAAADLQRIADDGDSEYLRALAQRY